MFFEKVRKIILNFEGVALLSIVVALAFMGYYLPSRHNKDLALETERQLYNRVESLQDEAKRLEEKCRLLEAGEPETVEQVIREQFGWGRAGEVLIALPETRPQVEQPASQQPQAPAPAVGKPTQPEKPATPAQPGKSAVPAKKAKTSAEKEKSAQAASRARLNNRN